MILYWSWMRRRGFRMVMLRRRMMIIVIIMGMIKIVTI
jgi:hypothetical protein